MMAIIQAGLRRARGLARLWRFTRPDSVVTLRLRQPSLIAGLGVVLIWNIVWPNPIALTLVVVLSSLLVFAFIWARSMAASVTSSRQLRYAALQVGDELEETVTLENRSPWPVLWAEFIDRSNIPGYTVAGVNAVSRRSTSRWPARTVCTRRGAFMLGPWELRLGDPFNIFDVKQVYHEQVELLVYPPLADLPPYLLPHRQKVGDLQPLQQPLRAETINVTTTRPYLNGDPRRYVHWRTTARQNQLFVKVFEPEAASSIWLIPDLDAAVHLGEGGDSSLETMVMILASLAAQLLEQRLAVGLLVETGESKAILPKYGQEHFWTILRALALLQPIESYPLAKTLTDASSLISTRDSIVVVTPSIDPDWPEALRQVARSRYRSGAEVILLDPASFGGATGVESFALGLAEQGITAHVVRRGDLRPISGAYGELRRWEFRSLATGKVIVRQTPREASSLAQTFG